MSKSKVVIGIEDSSRYSYSDAVVIKVNEDSYDVELGNGKVKKYVHNSSNRNFSSGDFVAVVFSNIREDDCKIIGKGKKIKRYYQIEKVLV